jgi:branched-chain amino acid transport system permease protein
MAAFVQLFRIWPSWFELIASGLITGGIYALIALGLNLQYGLMRILNIAHGEFLMLGAFLTWAAQTGWGCRRC